MAIQIGPVIILHERRIRVTFTAALAVGAFTSLSFYSVTSLSGQAASPSVVAAYIVANSPHVVELVLGADLVQGQSYQISAVGVPAQGGGGTTPDPSNQSATYGTKPQAVGPTKGGVSELDEVLYSRDLRFNDGDFVETPGGDLDTVAGNENLTNALNRRLLSNGLPWDPKYGLQAYQHVDGTGQGLLPLRGRAESQMKLDDRVSTVVARVTSDQAEAAGYVEVDVEPIGAGALTTLKIPVGF